ncbi:MAG: 13E12 repeat family protein, partial [Actinomycetota bacterium]|nr:13E12 repeat family protein [Actinomycetota bacterium]
MFTVETTEAAPQPPAPPRAEAEAPDLGALSFGQLERELREQAAHLDAGLCRFLELTAEVERRSDWRDIRGTSFARSLGWRCSLSSGRAREYARVAERLPELPLIRAAFGRGELSYG